MYKNRNYTKSQLAKLNAQIPEQLGKIPNDFEKRIAYYTTASAITNIWFSTLCNKKIYEEERQVGFWMGVLTPAQDDLTDNPSIDFSRIKLITENENIEPQNCTEFLAQFSAQKLLKLVSNRNLFYQSVEKTQIAQSKSRIQFEKTTNRNVLKKIEYEKGSASTLMYRNLISSDLKPNEIEMIAELGFLLQFLNDIFDVYKDREQHIYTLANTVDDIDIVKTELDEIIANFVSQLKLVNYKKTQKNKFLAHVFLIAARGYVCIEQYKNLQKNGKFQIANYSRKQLICDMEKSINIFKNLKYAYIMLKKVAL
ncbi:MAG: hypothetical protein EAZ53_00975 [Bacteroidetes bacterium]|nr:MAG: hypothetical protein EAZ53_00975 [Bacteroidota bacterium]